jgi:flagellar biogenesis protein FliO
MIVFGMALFMPAVLLAQDAGAGVSDPADASPSERIDETTLLLDGPADGGSRPALSISPFGIWDLFRMILVLGAVIGVMFGVVYLLKRSGKGRMVQNDAIRVLGSQSLPGNRSMYLVQVGAQVFLLGAGGDSVSLIAEITDNETVDAAILRAGESSVNGKKSFAEMISGIFKGNEGQSLGFMREQRERLQRLRQQSGR